MYNFSNIVLTKDEFKKLKLLKNQGKLVLNDNVAEVLLSYGLINKCVAGYDKNNNPIFDGTYAISCKGERYLINLSKLNRIRFFEWLRYIITTLIALTALIRTFLNS